MSWNPGLVVLISGVTLETYLCGKAIGKPARSARARKWFLLSASAFRFSFCFL
jgi:hypothetical protein